MMHGKKWPEGGGGSCGIQMAVMPYGKCVVFQHVKKLPGRFQLYHSWIYSHRQQFSEIHTSCRRCFSIQVDYIIIIIIIITIIIIIIIIIIHNEINVTKCNAKNVLAKIYKVQLLKNAWMQMTEQIIFSTTMKNWLSRSLSIDLTSAGKLFRR